MLSSSSLRLSGYVKLHAAETALKAMPQGSYLKSFTSNYKADRVGCLQRGMGTLQEQSGFMTFLGWQVVEISKELDWRGEWEK